MFCNGRGDGDSLVGKQILRISSPSHHCIATVVVLIIFLLTSQFGSRGEEDCDHDVIHVHFWQRRAGVDIDPPPDVAPIATFTTAGAQILCLCTVAPTKTSATFY